MVIMVKKVLILLVVLVSLAVGFFFGVQASNNYECLYGDCNKGGFVILEDSHKHFLIGYVKKNKGAFDMSRGVYYNKSDDLFYYKNFQKKDNILIIDKTDFAVGKAGKNKYGGSCVVEGLAFELDLSGYSKIKNPNCKAIEE